MESRGPRVLIEAWSTALDVRDWLRSIRRCADVSGVTSPICGRRARRASTTASGVIVATGCGVSAGATWVLVTAWVLVSALFVFTSASLRPWTVKAGGNDSTRAQMQAATGWKMRL